MKKAVTSKMVSESNQDEYQPGDPVVFRRNKDKVKGDEIWSEVSYYQMPWGRDMHKPRNYRAINLKKLWRNLD